MSRRNITWNSERILSLSAMSISIITLIIFIYQTNLMSRQNYLSILPYLQIGTSNNDSANTFSLDLMNHGVGPAIIESVRFQIDGQEYDLKDYNDYLYQFLVSRDSVLDSLKAVSYSTLNAGLAIPANSTYNVLKITFPEDKQAILVRLLDLLEGLPYEIRYKSIQDEHWIIHNDSEGPEKLN